MLRALSEGNLTAMPMRLASLTLVAAVLAASGCSRSQLEVVHPAMMPQPMRIASPVDTGFVRRTCIAPDSVLAGKRACYEHEAKQTVRVF